VDHHTHHLLLCEFVPRQPRGDCAAAADGHRRGVCG
jgi:hypothetical protein